MKTFGFDYLMVATLSNSPNDNERQAQYFREMKREAERQERNRQAWKARRKAFAATLASVGKRFSHIGAGNRVAAAS